ncbi:MAG: Opr family porin [Epsilonproteobacteria bacterium]|nr:Opr family porin [Campylobacterota bacterium]
MTYNKIKKNIFVSLLLLVVLPLYADSLSDALKHSKISADLTLHSLTISKKSPMRDFGFTNSSLGLGVETEKFYGVSSAISFRANHNLKERYRSDATEAVGTLLTTANLQYKNGSINIIAGRQELELEWFEDYHQAIVAMANIENNTNLTLGYSQKIADADDDEISPFEKIGEDGAFVLDIKNSSLDNVILNPYYMFVPKMFDALGLKAEFDNDDYGMTVHYAKSEERDREMRDGDIFNLEARAKFGDFKLHYGLIKTDKEGGIGSLDEMGDHINPLEDGEYEINSVYEKNAKSEYTILSYEKDNLLFSTMFRSTEYYLDGIEREEKELDFSIEYEIGENIESELLYAKIFADDSADDQDKVIFLLKFEL